MILVDTSVWIDHLRMSDDALNVALGEGEVVIRSFVIGELACGNMRNRAEVMSLLSDLPSCTEATNDEVLQLIQRHQLMGRGIGFVDAHLLAAAMLSPATTLWTRDPRLERIALELGVGLGT